MKGRAVAPALALIAVTVAAVPADAQVTCHWTSAQAVIGGKVVITNKKVCVATGGPTQAGSVVVAGGTAADVACAGAAAALHTAVASVCPAAPPTPGEPGPGLIAAAVWRLRLPPSALHIQPIKGRTLINLRTNFYATNNPIERNIVLLGRRIQVRVWANRYAWSFGDGSSMSTNSAGAPYPDLLVTHRYLRKGVVRPSLHTVYVAEYRIGQRAWRPVPGSARIPTPAQRLEVVTATPRLTDPYQ